MAAKFTLRVVPEKGIPPKTSTTARDFTREPAPQAGRFTRDRNGRLILTRTK